MAIRYAILGLLAEEPMHGYRLKEVFDRRVSPLWGLTTGQIYQSLAILERAALVESKGERRGRRPARRVYSITEAGERDLDAWLRSPIAFPRVFRHEMLIRLMVLGGDGARDLLDVIQRQADDARAMLAQVARLRARRTVDHDAFDLGAVFLASMTNHLEADIKNLELFHRRVARDVDRGAD